MKTGKVKWFDDKRGFGFLVCDGKDYFAHFKEIQTTGFKTLSEGDEVSFEPSTSPKGLIAKNILKLQS